MNQKSTQEVFRGSLEGMSLPDLLSMIETNQKTGILTISFPNTILQSRFAFQQGRVGRSQSAALPSWSVTLIANGISRDILESYRKTSGTVISLISQLHHDNILNDQKISSLLNERMVRALLPIFDRKDGNFSLVSNPDNDGFIQPGASVISSSLEAARRFDELRSNKVHHFNPEEYFIASSNPNARRHIEDLGRYDKAILKVLEDGYALIETAKKMNLPWDRLVHIVHTLTQKQLVSPYTPPPEAQEHFAETQDKDTLTTVTLAAQPSPAYIVFDFVLKRLLARLESYGSGNIQTALQPLIESSQLTRNTQQFLLEWLSGQVSVSKLVTPPLTQEQSSQLVDEIYAWFCDLVGPVNADQVLTSVIQQAEMLPESLEYSPRSLL